MATAQESEDAAIIEAFQSALKKNETDFTINLWPFTWRVHVDVLARKSDFFRRICMSSSWQENEEDAVTLHDDNPFAFARVLQFMYHGVYTYGSEVTIIQATRETVTAIVDLLASGSWNTSYEKAWDADDNKSLSALDLEVYDLADKYGISKLKELSLEQLVANLADEDVLETLFSRYHPDRLDQDQDLKHALATCIASNFGEIRNDLKQWNDGIGEWMRQDFELCTMVMDQMRSRIPEP